MQAPPGQYYAPPTPAPARRNAPEFIAAHSTLSLALIVLLIVIVVGQYAQSRGWIGAGAAPRKVADPEVDKLIDQINKH
jgi:hypothetical protein